MSIINKLLFKKQPDKEHGAQEATKPFDAFKEFERIASETMTEPRALEDELYLTEEEQEKRRIVFINCEDPECGFGLEFKNPNSTFYFCKEHGTGFNVDLGLINSAGVVCYLHGQMERYDLLKDDNVCPRCENSTLAVMSVGR